MAATGHEEKVEIILAVIGTVLLFGPLLAYYRILTDSYKNAQLSTLASQINASRTALFLPTYAVIMFLSLVIPVLFLPLQIPISIAEGYSFFCFFAMIVNYLGGPNRVVERTQSKFNDGKLPIFPFCCPETGLAFYTRTLRALYHFIITRTGFIFVAVILQMVMKYADLSKRQHVGVQVMSIIFQVVSLGFLVNAFMSLVIFFEMFYEDTKNLYGIPKIWLLKFSVVLIVIQGLVEQYLFTAHVLKINDSSNYNAEDRAQMIYCFIVLCEYFLLSYFFYWAYSVGISAPLSSPPLEEADQADEKTKVVVAEKGGGAGGDHIPVGAEAVDITFKEYLSRVFTLSGVWDNLDPQDSLKQPLTSADGQQDANNEA